MSLHDLQRTHMIDGQLRPNGIDHLGLLHAFAHIDRASFLPPKLKAVAYMDKNLEIRQKRFLLKPLSAAWLLQTALTETSIFTNCLMIGDSCGYYASLLHLMGIKVILTEEDPSLIDMLEHHMEGSQMYLHKDKLMQGCPLYAPYERIIVMGGVSLHNLSALHKQLTRAGCLIAVVNGSPMQSLCVIRHDGSVRTARIVRDVPSLEAFIHSSSFEFAD